MDAKLNVVEAERAIAIMEDTTEKLSFLDSITPDILQHRDELSKFIGDEISKTMSEQCVLEKKYERLIEQRSTMKGMVNKTKYRAIQEEIQEVSRALRESTNNLVRSLKENPNVSGNMIKVQRDRTELHDLLLRCIQELRDHGTFRCIMAKVDEENNSRRRFDQLKAREESLREDVRTLENELNEEESSFKNKQSQQNQAIQHMKDQMQSVKGSTSTDAKFKRTESLASVSAIWREYKLKERMLENRLAELENKLQTENVVNHETKDFLVRKTRSLNDETARWESKYEREVKETEDEKTTLTTDRTVLKEKLDHLRERKRQEEKEEALRQQRLAAEALLRKEQEILAKKQHKAARKIQKEMQNFLKRKKELDALKGAEKGKKGKKGKK
jgi:hypothetical protein